MTTLKTPEQIAREHLDKHFGGWPPQSAGQVTALIEAAIEADRAQRAEIHQDWRDDQENVRGAEFVDVAWTARRADGTAFFESDMALTAAEAIGMFQGIGEAQK